LVLHFKKNKSYLIKKYTYSEAHQHKGMKYIL